MYPGVWGRQDVVAGEPAEEAAETPAEQP